MIQAARQGACLSEVMMLLPPLQDPLIKWWLIKFPGARQGGKPGNHL